MSNYGGQGEHSNKCCRVMWNPIDETISYSCNMFEKVGCLCSHALKVLDTLNIKLLPEKYV
jgi:zinc finger SWIM domain-containing protein 3